MHARTDASGLETIASEVIATFGSGKQIVPFSQRPGGLSLDDAYRVTSLVHRQRAKNGAAPVGRKIGFTNKTLWQRYNVYGPIWGYMYKTTVHELSKVRHCELKAFSDPLIEPEIVFGLARQPEATMDDQALLACIEWIAHGFEIVQTIYPSWQFAAPDTVAANGLHGALFIGERYAVEPCAADWQRGLSDFEATLCRNGDPIEKGHSANVLGGPVSALRHLVQLLSQDQNNGPLGGHEIVTTGTLTSALPIKPGERWSTVLDGIALDGISIELR